MEIREGAQLIEKGAKKAIIEFVFTDYVIYVFQGNLSQFDIVIKYKKDGKRIRTPKHIHWVVDILMKMQGNEVLTKKYLLAIQNCWNTCVPLTSNDFTTLKALIENGEEDIEITQFFDLNVFGEYDVEFLYEATKPLFIDVTIKTSNEREVYIMKNNTTELVFILDRSGSMSGIEADTIGGFNAMIEKQKKMDGKCFVSTVLFDNESEVIHDRVELENVKPMTDRDYTVRGCTALLDAIGGAIRHIGNIHKYARHEDVPENTMFVITTDGMENASHRFDSKQVKQMIERQKEKFGWEFIFVAANIDAVETARNFGIDENRAVNYHADAKGTACLYDNVSDVVCSVRMGCDIEDGWSEKLQKDFKSRK